MEVRPVDPADIARSYEIRTRSFGVAPASSRPDWEAMARAAIEEGRSVGAYDGSLLVGRAMFWPFRQWWGGRVLSMAGVAGVVVSPEYRGGGVGSALMRGVIARGRELGFPLAALYPATVPVYRTLGWEVAGVQSRVTVDAAVLRDLRGGEVRVRQAGPDDAAAMLQLMRREYTESRVSGPKDETEAQLRDELADESVFAYLADEGFVVYGWDRGDLAVYQFHARDAATARALWAVVGSGSSIAKRVHAYLSPDDPLHLLARDAVSPDVHLNRWMLRCLDASAAIAGRGFPAGVSIDVPLVLEDAQVAGNRFTGRLQVDDGVGALVPGPVDRGAVTLSPNGLAAVFAGGSVTVAQRAGLASGGDSDSHAFLDAAFAGRPAFMLEYF
jgi:predicted acetyltransferase